MAGPYIPGVAGSGGGGLDFLNPLSAQGSLTPVSYGEAYRVAGPAPLGLTPPPSSATSMNDIGEDIGKTNFMAAPNLRPPQTMPDRTYIPLGEEKGPGFANAFLRTIADFGTGVLPPDIAEHIENGFGALGDVLDFIGDNTINKVPAVPNLPFGSPFTKEQQAVRLYNQLPDTDSKLAVEEAIRNDPASAIWYITQYLEHNREEVAAGLGMSPLLADFVMPVGTLGEQLGKGLLSVALPGTLVSRTYAGMGMRNIQESILDAPEGSLPEMVESIKNKFLASGQTQKDWDTMLDSLALNGYGWSNDAFHNLVFEMLTDPANLLGAAGVAERLVARGGRTALAVAAARQAATALGADGMRDLLSRVASDVVAEFTSKRIALAPEDAQRLANENLRILNRLEIERPDIVNTALESMPARQRAIVKMDPVLRRVAKFAQSIADPLEAFGRGDIAKRMQAFTSAAATEGMTHAYGPGRVSALRDFIRKMAPDHGDGIFVTVMGRAAANIEAAVHRDAIVRTAVAAGKVAPHFDPDSAVRAMSEAHSSRLVTMVEGFVRRVKTQYLPTAKVGEEAVAQEMARVRSVAEQQLARILGEDADPIAIKAFLKDADTDTLALIQHLHYGWVVGDFITARNLSRSMLKTLREQAEAKLATVTGRRTVPKWQKAVARAKGREDLGPRFTLVGPNELTHDRAKTVLNAARRGDANAVREAIERYDRLYNNFAAKGLTDDELLHDVQVFLQELTTAGGKRGRNGPLVRVVSRSELPAPLRDFLDREANFARRTASDGYVIGLAPDAEHVWRSVLDPETGRLVGINPWLDVIDEQAGDFEMSRLDRARAALFRPIRGERLLEEARRGFRARAVHIGMSRKEANALFSAIRGLASERGVMPRGLTPGELWDMAKSMDIEKGLLNQIGERGLARLVAAAFEGDLMTVGLTQKVSGRAKTLTANRTGNWLGIISERMYPAVRFTYNPIFILQETIEPFFWNVLRGIKPGIHWRDIDIQTWEAMRRAGLISEFEDQWEFSAASLIGAVAAKEAAGPTTLLGRLWGNYIDQGRKVRSLAELKRLNYVRQVGQLNGEYLKQSIDAINPGFWDVLAREVGTTDPATIANYYWLNKGLYSPDDPKVQVFLMDATKPDDLGRMATVRMPELSRFHNFVDPAAMRKAIREGSYTEAQFRAQMGALKADPHYTDRAWKVASMPSPDEWWSMARDAIRQGPAGGNARMATTLTTSMRNLIKRRASVLGFTEEEYLATRFSERVQYLNSATMLPRGARHQLMEEEGLVIWGKTSLLPDTDARMDGIRLRSSELMGTTESRSAEVLARGEAMAEGSETIERTGDLRPINPDLYPGERLLGSREATIGSTYVPPEGDEIAPRPIRRVVGTRPVGEFDTVMPNANRIEFETPSGTTGHITGQRDVNDFKSLVGSTMQPDEALAAARSLRQVPALMTLLVDLMPDNFIWEALIRYGNPMGLDESWRMASERLNLKRAERDLDPAIRANKAENIASGVTDEELASLPDDGSGNWLWQQPVIEMAEIDDTVEFGTPNTGVHLERESVNKDSTHHYFGWYNDDGELSAVAHVVDPKPGGEAKRMVVGGEEFIYAPMDYPFVNSLATKPGAKRQGLATKLYDYLTSTGIFEAHDITGRDVYTPRGSAFGTEYARRGNKRVLEPARNELAARMTAAWAHLMKQADFDHMSATNALIAMLDVMHGFDSRSARAAFSIRKVSEEVHGLLARWSDDVGSSTTWLSRENLDATLDPANAIPMSQELMRAFGYVDEVVFDDLERANALRKGLPDWVQRNAITPQPNWEDMLGVQRPRRLKVDETTFLDELMEMEGEGLIRVVDPDDATDIPHEPKMVGTEPSMPKAPGQTLEPWEFYQRGLIDREELLKEAEKRFPHDPEAALRQFDEWLDNLGEKRGDGKSWTAAEWLQDMQDEGYFNGPKEDFTGEFGGKRMGEYDTPDVTDQMLEFADAWVYGLPDKVLDLTRSLADVSDSLWDIEHQIWLRSPTPEEVQQVIDSINEKIPGTYKPKLASKAALEKELKSLTNRLKHQLKVDDAGLKQHMNSFRVYQQALDGTMDKTLLWDVVEEEFGPRFRERIIAKRAEWDDARSKVEAQWDEDTIESPFLDEAMDAIKEREDDIKRVYGDFDSWPEEVRAEFSAFVEDQTESAMNAITAYTYILDAWAKDYRLARNEAQKRAIIAKSRVVRDAARWQRDAARYTDDLLSNLEWWYEQGPMAWYQGLSEWGPTLAQMLDLPINEMARMRYAEVVDAIVQKADVAASQQRVFNPYGKAKTLRYVDWDEYEKTAASLKRRHVVREPKPEYASHMRKTYQQWAMELNAEQWLGRANWTAGEVAAVDMERYRRFTNRGPAWDTQSALSRNTYALKFETSPGPANKGTWWEGVFPDANLYEKLRNNPRLPADLRDVLEDEWSEGRMQVDEYMTKWWASRVSEVSGVEVLDYYAHSTREAVNWDALPDDPEGVVQSEWFQRPGGVIVVVGSDDAIERAVLATGAVFQREEVTAVSMVPQPPRFELTEATASTGNIFQTGGLRDRPDRAAAEWRDARFHDFVLPEGTKRYQLEEFVQSLDDDFLDSPDFFREYDFGRMTYRRPDGRLVVRVIYDDDTNFEVASRARAGASGAYDKTQLKNVALMDMDDGLKAEIRNGKFGGVTGVEVDYGTTRMYSHKVSDPKKTAEAAEHAASTPAMQELAERQAAEFRKEPTVRGRERYVRSKWAKPAATRWRLAGEFDEWLNELSGRGASELAERIRNRYRGEALTQADIAHQAFLPQLWEAKRELDVNLPPPLRGDDWHFSATPKGVRGALKWDTEHRASMYFLSSADATTVVHELFHLFVPDLQPSMTKSLLAEYAKANGLTRVPTKWTHKAEDWAAEQFVRYMRDGHAENSVTQSALNAFGRYVKDIIPDERVSPEVRELFDQLWKLPSANVGAVFNPDEHRVFAAARYAMQKAEDEAFTTHYFRRGRSLVERTVNHPYLGYYPASYMWGKVVPEMVRFLAAKPFGLKAPMWGYAQAMNVWESVAMQYNTDPDVRGYIEKHPNLVRFMQMLLPGTPWDMPVVLPAWARNAARESVRNEERLRRGEEPRSFDLLGSMSETANYAFGPLRFLDTAAGVTADIRDSLPGSGPAQPQVPKVPSIMDSINAARDELLPVLNGL